LQAEHADAAATMRPYSGIGVLKLYPSIDSELALFDEPGLIRCCYLDLTSAKKLYADTFCHSEEPSLLVFSAKGDWFMVEYDDAGRQAWVQSERYWNFQPWPDFLKGRSISFLRTAPRKFLLLSSAPESDSGLQISYNIPMRAILVQADWAFVIVNPQQSGWIRWRDPDGRLLVSVNCADSSSQNR
jgi:hypothetical protein